MLKSTASVLTALIMTNGVVTRSFGGVVRVIAENESDIVLALIDTVDNDFASGAVSFARRGVRL